MYRIPLNKYERLVEAERQVRVELEEAKSKQVPEHKNVRGLAHQLKLSKTCCLEIQSKYNVDVKRPEDEKLHAVSEEKALREKKTRAIHQDTKQIIELARK